MKRTPEAIADSNHALEIGTRMLICVEPGTKAFLSCREGLDVLQNWINGAATVAECRASAFKIHEAARTCPNLRERDAIRSIGHAVATAHVSSHLKACKEYSDKVSPI